MKNQELMMDKLNTDEILTLKWKGFPSSKIEKTGLKYQALTSFL